MLRPSSHPSHPVLPPIPLSSPSIPCGNLAPAFLYLSSSTCRGGSLDPRFSPRLCTSVSFFSLISKRCARVTSSFSYSCALFKNELCINPFLVNSFRTLLQNTRGMPLRSNLHCLIFKNVATRHSSFTAKSRRIRTYLKTARNLFRIRTSKTKDLKPFRIRTYEKTPGGPLDSSFSPTPETGQQHPSVTLVDATIRKGSMGQGGATRVKTLGR